jgi:hypothetical protein
MTFSLILTITHPSFKPIEHIDMLHGSSKSVVLKQLKITNKQLSDLRNTGHTTWIDSNGATHLLQFKHEAN